MDRHAAFRFFRVAVCYRLGEIAVTSEDIALFVFGLTSLPGLRNRNAHISGTNDATIWLNRALPLASAIERWKSISSSVVWSCAWSSFAIASASATIRAAWTGVAFRAASAAVRISIVGGRPKSATLIWAVDRCVLQRFRDHRAVESAYLGATAIGDVDQAKGRERSKGFAHHRAAHAQFVGEKALAGEGIPDAKPGFCGYAPSRRPSTGRRATSLVGCDAGHQAATKPERRSLGGTPNRRQKARLKLALLL